MSHEQDVQRHCRLLAEALFSSLFLKVKKGRAERQTGTAAKPFARTLKNS